MGEKSLGAERLKARLPMGLRPAGGTERWMEEEDLREDAAMWRRSERSGGARLWMALTVFRRNLNMSLDLIGSQFNS